MNEPACRLYLIAPTGLAPLATANAVASAAEGGDIAAVLVPAGNDTAAVCAACAPITAPAGIALIVAGADSFSVPGEADGLHLENADPKALALAVKRLHPRLSVGVGAIEDRHAAMLAGEEGPDYVMFGRIADSTPASADLVGWWSELFTIPSVAIIGDRLEDAALLIAAGADFVAAGNAVWNARECPADAVARLNRLCAGEVVA
ncbi:MAG: thiamine phosphate synthase [Rhodobiaceae bacterium]|nr:thiamine phosphate synthase [Rhodobiaceae bacterium]MCC0057250.1 thiamine phosphate synthase [Rhodobiaceae bacterium]